MSKLSNHQHSKILSMYLSGSYTTESIAKQFNITSRSVQRLAKKHGIIRTQAEANRLSVPLKSYHKTPLEFRVKRKHISRKQRYLIINKHPYCTNCGLTVEQGIRLEVDHIDEDATNNMITNLQVLCNLCNGGKSQLARFGLKDSAD